MGIWLSSVPAESWAKPNNGSCWEFNNFEVCKVSDNELQFESKRDLLSLDDALHFIRDHYTIVDGYASYDSSHWYGEVFVK